MTDRKLREALLKALQVSPQRLSQRVQELKRRCPMGTEDATYCIAHQEGIRLDKFLTPDKVEGVRALLTNISSAVLGGTSTQPKPKTIVKTREVTVGGGIKIQDPIVTEKVLGEAREMAGKVYPMLYVFENSVRDVIQRVMGNKVGEDWWNTANIPVKIRRDVDQRRQREDKEAWHGKRGTHSIYYTDIDDLIGIVQNNWNSFRQIFPRQDWFANIVTCMEISRNTVAHMNPLRKHDFDRVRVNLRDWQQQISRKKSLIP